jgi:hypothetical protein
VSEQLQPVHETRGAAPLRRTLRAAVAARRHSQDGVPRHCLASSFAAGISVRAAGLARVLRCLFPEALEQLRASQRLLRALPFRRRHPVPGAWVATASRISLIEAKVTSTLK